jgi:hypothetical protein
MGRSNSWDYRVIFLLKLLVEVVIYKSLRELAALIWRQVLTEFRLCDCVTVL